ncbi:hypothetical protein HUG15_19980 [Salicibibacter cibarius]|uniref:Lipoprotein n=1 Tax=Salicibibacter cibarius TaxID=2743000 RepID=A0A7T7CD48_9BACI|nr:hypothetical protein [Salicibibacter cibarius]QQK77639.1 hypothetical protein HUG15_19980 [Salicibibacter cibarius]
MLKHMFYLGVVPFLALTGCSNAEEEVAEAKKADDYSHIWEDDERHLESLDTQLSDEDYETIEELFHNFELPEEGQLTTEEAHDHFPDVENQPDDYFFSDGDIIYENYYVFDADTQKLNSLISNPDPDSLSGTMPYDTQSLGVFMTSVEQTNQQVRTPTGETIEGTLPDLTDEDHEALSDDDYQVLSKEDMQTEDVKGWLAMQLFIDLVDGNLEQMQPHIKDYEELYTWAEETRQHAQVADRHGYNNYEAAYDHIQKATENLEKMNEVIPD